MNVLKAVFICCLIVGGYDGRENSGNCTKSMLDDMSKRVSSCSEPLATYRQINLSLPVNEVYENMCALLFMRNLCTRDAWLSRSCLSSQALEFVRVSFNTSNNYHKYVCVNNARGFIDFYKNNSVQCIIQAKNDRMTCLNSTVTSLNGLEYGLPIDIQTYCRDSETIQKCITDTMESNTGICSASVVERISESIDIYNGNFGCNGSLKNETTKQNERTKGGYYGRENSGNCTKSMLKNIRKRVSSCNEPLATYGQNNFQSILSLPINELFENICAKLFTQYSCTRDVMSLTCRGSKYLEYIRVGHEALIKSTEYLCNNKAQRYVDFYINKGNECMRQAGNDFMTCLNGTATLLNGFEYGLPIDIQTYCRDSETIKKCIIDTMESYPDNCSASVVETVSETLDIYKKNLGCNGSLKNDRTKGYYGRENSGNCTKENKMIFRKKIYFCYSTDYNYTSVNYTFHTDPTNPFHTLESLQNKFEIMCANRFILYSCLRNAYLSQSCAGSNFLEFITVAFKALEKSTEYLCDNKAQRILAMFSKINRRYITKRLYSYGYKTNHTILDNLILATQISHGYTCVTTKLEKGIRTCINDTSMSWIIESVNRYDIQAYCRVLETIKKCITDPMESNPVICSASVVETVSETVDIFNNNVGCNGSL